MNYIVIFDFVLKSIAYLFGIGFCIFLIISEIKTEKRNREVIKRLREIEKSCDSADENVKEFVHAYVDSMEELLTM